LLFPGDWIYSAGCNEQAACQAENFEPEEGSFGIHIGIDLTMKAGVLDLGLNKR
jgi:hypothetical protein